MSKKVQIVAIAIIAIAIIRIATSLIVADPVKSSQDSGLTKSKYLDMVRINYKDDDTLTLEETLCSYDYLIDKYGVKETYKMDLRAEADENDIDNRLIEAIQKCI